MARLKIEIDLPIHCSLTDKKLDALLGDIELYVRCALGAVQHEGGFKAEVIDGRENTNPSLRG